MKKNFGRSWMNEADGASWRMELIGRRNHMLDESGTNWKIKSVRGLTVLTEVGNEENLEQCGEE